MKIAFYKGTQKGISGIYNRLVRWITSSKYSHCEIIFCDGIAASASYLDKGVRFKSISFNPANWDFIEIPDTFEPNARYWFERHEHQGYDLLGNLQFLLGFVRQGKAKWFCSEALAESLGIKDSWRYTPATLHSTLQLISRS